MTDIEIAQAHEMKPITEIAAAAGIDEQHLELYGKYKAKLDLTEIRKLPRKAKLILVTAISPTPAGEGKTTTSVGLADALNKIGKKTMVCLREPSLGPVFGVKGGAAGGGYAQVVPMEDINLHFTGDFHAIGAANNLLAAMLDNHIQQGNALNIDPRRIVWKRAVDMNDRQLRHIIDGLGGKASGVPREDGFEITVASEIMAVLCLSSDLADLKARLAKMVVAYTYDDQPVTAHDLKAEGAMAALLKDAIKPNLVQTLEGTPAFIHGGPFANIAHGCNSLQATETAMRLSDYTVTEAGFAADLGAEKFLDIKCRAAGFHPNAVVIVATVRALKYHGGVPKAELNNENLEALEKGLPNLLQHVDNVKNVYGLPCVVAVNAFPTDTAAELALVESKCRELGVNIVVQIFVNGLYKCIQLAEEPFVHNRKLVIVKCIFGSIEVINICIKYKECIGIPQSTHEFTLTFLNSLAMETVRQPWCTVDVEVPADGICTVCLKCIKRINCISLGLAHLLSVLILYMYKNDNVLIWSLIKQKSRLSKKGVEPSSCLVNSLRNKVCRELLFEQFLILKWIMMLCKWHCS